MAFVQIPVTNQYVDDNGDPYVGATLKAYIAGTSTAIALATDYTGGTTAAYFVLNSNGITATSGGTQVYPNITDANSRIKLILYATEALAIANDATGALFNIDNISVRGGSLGGGFSVGGITALKAITSQQDDDVVELLWHTTEGDFGGGTMRWKDDDTTTDDNGIYFQKSGGGTGRWIRQYTGEIYCEFFGFDPAASAATNTAAFLAAISFAHNAADSPRVRANGGDFNVDPVVVPDGESAFFAGGYREKTVLINSSTTADCLNFTGEHDSIILHHFRVKALTSSTGVAIHFPAGAGDAIRDVDLDQIAYEGHTDGLHIFNVLNVRIGKIWRATGLSVDSGAQSGTGLYVANSGGGSSTDITIDTPYISNFSRGIRSLSSRCRVLYPIVENFSDYAFYAEGSGKMIIVEPSPSTSAGFSATNLYRRDDGAYMHVSSTRDGFSNITTPFNVGTNGRFKYIKDKMDNVIAFSNGNVAVNPSTPNYADIDDWVIMAFDKDVAADSPARDYGQDTEGNYNTTTYQYTAPAPGKYKLDFQATIDIQTNGKYVIAIFKGSTTTGKICEAWFREKAADASQNFITLRAGATVYLNHLDTVEVRVWQDSGVSQDVVGSKGIYNHEAGSGTNTADPSHLSFFEIVALG